MLLKKNECRQTEDGKSVWKDAINDERNIYAHMPQQVRALIPADADTIDVAAKSPDDEPGPWSASAAANLTVWSAASFAQLNSRAPSRRALLMPLLAMLSLTDPAARYDSLDPDGEATMDRAQQGLAQQGWRRLAADGTEIALNSSLEQTTLQSTTTKPEVFLLDSAQVAVITFRGTTKCESAAGHALLT